MQTRSQGVFRMTVYELYTMLRETCNPFTITLSMICKTRNMIYLSVLYEYLDTLINDKREQKKRIINDRIIKTSNSHLQLAEQGKAIRNERISKQDV